MIFNFVNPHKISFIYLEKQKSFVPKKVCTIFLEQNFFVCQDRNLYDLDFRETSQNFAFYLDQQKSFVPKKVRPC